MSRPRPQPRLAFGIALALLGLIFLLDNFHLFDARSVLPFWPVVFIVLGTLKLIQTRHRSGYVLGIGLVLAGVLMTLRHLGYIEFLWRDWWPVLLIALGVLVIVKGQFRLGWHPEDHPVNTAAGNDVAITAIMSGNQSKMDTQAFTGGEITATMGGVELDLRAASMASQATLQVFVLMGGVDIKIPEDWSVTVNAMPLLGGIEDKSVPPAQPLKRLTIQGYVIMGGIEIKN